jgi:hypothetical protein
MRVLFLFLDGVGLGSGDPLVNPFARAEMPNLAALLGGGKFLRDGVPVDGERATLLALDACLSVNGLPQSATGQAVLLTGRNVPAEIGYHYGPKPDKATASCLEDGGIFGTLTRAGKRADLINAYPAGYFRAINSGKRLYSSIPLAVTKAGLSLHTADDLLAGRAISADLTGQGWRERLGYPDFPVLSLVEAGQRLADLSANLDFAFFEYWLTDYAGHGQDMDAAIRLLEGFDAVFGGLLDAWDDESGLILLTSDHGNLEDLSTRRHTANPVPLLLVGNAGNKEQFTNVTDLTGVTTAILKALNVSSV